MTWRNKTLIIGAVAGLLLGLASAYIVIKRSEEMNEMPQITPGDGVKIALGVLGVLRLVADVAEQG
jgi:hypothetical protein